MRKQSEVKDSSSPVLHAQSVDVQQPDLVVAHDVVHLHVEAMSLLLEDVALGPDVLQLVCQRLHAVLQELVLHKQTPIFYS